MEDEKPQKQKKAKEQKPNEIWNDAKEPLKEDEELVYDSSAYEMLHKSNVEWPCLSIDVVVRDRSGPSGLFHNKKWFPSEVGGALAEGESYYDSRLSTRIHKEDKFPMTVYFCGGSQAVNKSENKLYVMKWSDMHKTVHEDDEISDDSEDDEDDILEKINNKFKEPIIRYETIPHRGCVNRLRTLHGSSVVATWNDEGEVGIYNIESALAELDKPLEEAPHTEANSKKKKKKQIKKPTFGGTKVA
jgi:ribosome assembly protein RRB1